MGWEKTSCALCGINCGLEVQIENNHIAKVRPDKENPQSEGYTCRKGLNIAFHQHNADRLTHPLKKVGKTFERISWDQAVKEISDKLKGILDRHGPRSLAWMLSGQGCHFGLAFAARFGNMLGSQYNYTALGQEYTGRFWAHGLTMGSQGLQFVSDYHNTDMIMFVGWNPMMSHGTPQARRKFQKMAKDPNILLVVIDPRLSETAKIADIHLPLRPGTDALLFKAMVGLIIQEGWHNQDYIERHVTGFNEIIPWFTDIDIRSALKVCQLEYEKVYEVCRAFATRKSCLHDDLGILMNRHSTLVSYLLVVLQAICGRIGVPGGNYFPSRLAGGAVHSNPDDPNTWRTVVTNIPAIQGIFPPNVMPEEILTDHPDRLRAVFAVGSNPLRSYADTTAYEEAFQKLDLLVTVEMAMSETAAVSHYVLPAKSAYESWDTTMFPSRNWPEVFFQMRHPVVRMEEEQKESGEAFTLLAEAMGLIPEIPETLFAAAESGCSRTFRDALLEFLKANPGAMRAVLFVLAKTLGQALGSVHLASLCALLQTRPESLQQEAARAGFALGPEQGLELFKAIVEHPQGLLVGIADPEKNLANLATPDGRIKLNIKDFQDWLKEINSSEEEQKLVPDDSYPFILVAGRHWDTNANTNMRNPEWNKGKRACTLLMHPEDAQKNGFLDRQIVRLITEAGEETIEIEISNTARIGQLVMPHGFGLIYDGGKYGANVNRLTKNTYRDRVAATPLHRYVPCRIEPW
jgi:anaerobic selenocysteine-containing dehydrogenase